jgi:hypothetical protein
MVKNQCRENKNWSQWLSLEDQPLCCFMPANAFIFLTKKQKTKNPNKRVQNKIGKRFYYVVTNRTRERETLFTTFRTAGQQIQ